MNAERELLCAYREWRRLVQAEARAILTRNWNLLADCHRAIQDCQVRVATLTPEARSEWQRAGFDLEEKKRAFHALAADLLDVTRQNHGLLQQLLAAARNQLDQLHDGAINLKRLQRSYGFAAGRHRFGV